ncbi:MAG: hypothetical protein VW840_05700 [Gammaproteobacteria bacterium]
MDEEENRETIQIPLINDLVFDESLALRPPSKPKRTAATRKATYSPHSDPYTIDLFGDVDVEPEGLDDIPDFDTTLEATLDAEPASPAMTRPDNELREELTRELDGILETLGKPD